MAEGIESAGSLVVVLQEEAVELRPLEDPGDRFVSALRVVATLVVAAADVHAKRDPGVVADDRVVELNAGVDELVGITSALAVSLSQLGIEKRGVLGGVDLDIGTAQPAELGDLAPAEIDDIRQVRIPTRVGGPGFFRIVVGGCLLGADECDFCPVRRFGSEINPFLGAHASPPAKALDDDRALQDQLITRIIAERNRPATFLVEPVHGVDQMTVERVATLLPIGNHINPGRFLEGDGLIDRPILDAFELDVGQGAGVALLARGLQIGWAQQAADDLTPNGFAGHG